MTMLEDMAKDSWEVEVADEGGEAEWIPKLVVSYGTKYELIAMIQPPQTHVTEAIQVIGSDFLTSEVRWIALSADTHYTTNMSALNHGETLAAQAARGVPGIHSAMVISAVSRDGAEFLSVLPYRVWGNRVEWLEGNTTVHAGKEMAGGVYEALKQALEVSKNRTDRDDRMFIDGNAIMKRHEN